MGRLGHTHRKSRTWEIILAHEGESKEMNYSKEGNQHHANVLKKLALATRAALFGAATYLLGLIGAPGGGPRPRKRKRRRG